MGRGRELFRAVIGPWMVGRYETIDVHYDEATDDIVIGYVGKPVERPITTAADPTTSSGWTNLTKLFDTVNDEKWAPSTPLGGGEPLHTHRTEPGNLANIDHIIILMQENRSFAQVFGYLSREGYPGLGVCERHGRQAWARRPNPNAGLSAFPRRFRASSSMRRRE